MSKIFPVAPEQSLLKGSILKKTIVKLILSASNRKERATNHMFN